MNEIVKKGNKQDCKHEDWRIISVENVEFANCVDCDEWKCVTCHGCPNCGGKGDK